MTSVRIAGLIGLLCATLCLGQKKNQDPKPDSLQKPALPSIRVDIDLVLVNAAVTDSANRHVTGLQPEHFRLWEDKIEQQIEYFSVEDLPISVGIIFDVSGSMQNKLEPARAAADTFMRMGGKEDEYFLIQFSDTAQTIQEFTTDVGRIQSSLLFTRASGSTALYDALYLGLEKVERGSNSRKALLLITDGLDNHSRYSFSDVREFAREHDVLIYSIGLVDEGDPLGTGYGGKAVLESLARLTGGVAFFPRFLSALESICTQIAVDLKNQYLLGYRPQNSSSDGRWRKIRVKVDRPKGAPPLNVRAKSGYYAPTIARAMK
jgi:Ca-activated chloride channel family protein